MEPYYYSQMNKSTAERLSCHENRAYVDGPSFMVPQTENRELGIFFPAAPGLSGNILCIRISLSFYPEANKVEMIPEYLF